MQAEKQAQLVVYLEEQKAERVAQLEECDAILARKHALEDELAKANKDLELLGDTSQIEADCAKLDDFIAELTANVTTHIADDVPTESPVDAPEIPAQTPQVEEDE